ncbi:phosphatidylglycerol lysyltransferase domain-containing protein, partial [Staphylococcus aureus]|uniref:phosphatidylglycerol lysyltransferase domain-containing protein n=1 Tax=Staphylococcus aureus TaxID=1280 RepID=UPI001F5E0515
MPIKLSLVTSLLRYYLWMTAIVIFIIVAFIVWLFEQAYSKARPTPDFERCSEIIEQYGGNYLSHLIHSGDKDVFMDDSQEAFVMYRYKSNTLVVLGDPIGNPARFNHLL